MDIGQELIFALKRKYGGMQEASDALGISRTTLYQKIQIADRDKEFQSLLKVKAGLDINTLSTTGGQETDVIREKKVENATLRFNVVRLGKDRFAEVWLPPDFGKADVRTFEKWLELIESTL